MMKDEIAIQEFVLIYGVNNFINSKLLINSKAIQN